MSPFDDVTVVVATTTISGSYAAKLLGDGGATVTLVEPEPHPLRAWACAPVERAGALFAYLHHGHRSVRAVDLEALRGSDVVVTEPGGPLGDPAELAAADPGLVVVSISPWGLTGPWVGRPASELVLQAASGSLGTRGRPDTSPLQMGGHVTEWVSGAYAATAATAALRTARHSGHGELIDLSQLEVSNVTSSLFADLMDDLRGRPDLTGLPAPRSFETPSIEPTADGYVGFNTNTRLQFDAFCVLIDRTDLLEDPTWASPLTRNQRWEEWNDIVHAWTTRHTTAEVVEAAVALRIPCVPVTDAEGVLAIDHLQGRGVFVEHGDGWFAAPRRPWAIDGVWAEPPAPAPQWAAHDGDPVPSTRRVPAPTGPRRRPLEGLRVLDLTAWWAGPSATATLATMGAEVIHVESCAHPDGIRMAGAVFMDRPSWWDRSGIFLHANINKLDVTLDLSSERGRELLLALVPHCDVVVENFTPRVLEQFGLTWEVLSALHPELVMVRMPAFGLDGPWRDRPGFAQTMEQVTGLAWVTGEPDDQPRIQRGPCDPNAGQHGALAVLAGLAQRDRTGRGCFVESPMVEAALAVAAEFVIEWSAYGHRLERIGNRSLRAAPQGLYRCAGEEQWLALSVGDDTQWAALCQVAGRTDWAADPDLADHAGRWSRHDDLDAGITAWLADADAADTAERLAAAGVAAAVMVDPRRSSLHPQMVARGYTEVVDHPVVGPMSLPSMPYRWASRERWIDRHPPSMGEHNRQVLGGLLGLTDAELEQLYADGVIGDRPQGF